LIRDAWCTWTTSRLQRRANIFKKDTGTEHVPEYKPTTLGKQVPLAGIRIAQDWWTDASNPARFTSRFLVREFQSNARFWVTELRAAGDEYSSYASVRMGIESAEYTVTPITWTLRTPGLWSEITSRLLCKCGGVEHVYGTVCNHANGDINQLVVEFQQEDRKLPIIVISVSNSTQKAPVDPMLPQALSRELFALASVHYLCDAETCWALSDAIGSEHSCYNGAIRVYWPGFNPGRAPDYRTLLLPDRIIYRSPSSMAAVSAVASSVLRKIAIVSTARFQLPKVISELGHAQEQSLRQVEAERLRAELAKSVDETAISLIDDAMRKKDDEIRELRSRYEDQIATLKNQISDVYQLFESRSKTLAGEDADSQDDDVLTVEYFTTSNKRRPVLDFADDELGNDIDGRHEYLAALTKMSERWSESGSSRFEKLAGSQFKLRSGPKYDIWEYRAIQRQGGWVRVFFILIEDNTALLLHAVHKKQNSLSQADITTAQNRAKKHLGE